MMEFNKIYLADAYKAIKEIPDKSVDLIYTDVPYDIEDNGGGGASARKKETITPNTGRYAITSIQR